VIGAAAISIDSSIRGISPLLNAVRGIRADHYTMTCAPPPEARAVRSTDEIAAPGVHLFSGARWVCLAKSREKTLLNAHRIIQMHLSSLLAQTASRGRVFLQRAKVPQSANAPRHQGVWPFTVCCGKMTALGSNDRRSVDVARRALLDPGRYALAYSGHS
jgi:hypothetical protein